MWIWTLRNWRRIWFCDMSRFLLQRCDVAPGYTRSWQIWRWMHHGVGSNILQRRCKPGACQMKFYGSIWYRDDNLQPHMLTLSDRNREMFQQDSARSHTASNYRFPNSEQHQSRDFNPIDHLWNEFHRVLGVHGGNNRYWPVGDCFKNLCLVSRYSCVIF